MNILSQPVLILNACYIPISIRPVKDAVCMMLLEKAQAIKSSDYDFIRSEKLKIPVPYVLLLSNYYSVPKKILRATRGNILERDNYACVYCSKRPPVSKLTLDHIIPRSRWDEVSPERKPNEFNSWENLVTACRECNTKKGSKLLSELKWKLPETFKLKPRMNGFPAINKNSAEKYGWNEYIPGSK
jgi:5-methylcytosine-specific restriction endonuclease McrA